MDMTPHEFIEVGNRRWCMGCSLFQMRRPGSPWHVPASNCPRETPYARGMSGETTVLSEWPPA